MADNVTLDGPGAGGSDIATDQIGAGAHYQRLKITDGVADSELHLGIVADDAAVVAADTGILAMAVATPTDTAVDANDTGYVGMSLDRRLHTDTDIAIDGTSVTGGAGGVAPGTPRVTLASDDPAVAKLGTIDTDTGTIAGDTTSIDGKITVGAGTEAAAIRVTLPTDGTGKVTAAQATAADLNCTEASAAAILSDTTGILSDTASIQTAVETIDNIVHVENVALGTTPSGALAMGRQDAALTATGSIDDDAVPLHVDANGALWVTPSGTVTVTATNLDCQSGGADIATEVTSAAILVDTGQIQTAVEAVQTAVETIDNPVLVEDVAFAGGSVMMAGAIRDDALTTLTPIDGDAVPLRVSSTGALHVTGGGGGTEYNVDDAGPTVVSMAGVVRDDALTTLTEVDGDATLLRVSSTGALHVTGGGGGTEYTEDVATPATIVGTATMIERDDVLTATPIAGDWLALKGSAEGALWTQDFNSDALLTDTNAMVVDLASIQIATEATQAAVEGTLTVGSHAVTNAGTFTIQEDGAALTALQLLDNTVYVENAALGTTPSGNLAMARQDAALTATGSVDDDATPLTVDANGALWVTPSGTVTVDATGQGDIPVTGTLTAITDITNPITANPASGTITTVSTVTNLSQMGGVAITRGNGISGTGVQRVSIASDSTGQVKLAAGTAEIGKLAAGTAGIGKLTANSGVDIGDVDVTSLPGSATSAATAFDSYTHAAINLTTGANQVLVSSAASKQIWVYGIGFSCSAAGTGVSFQDELDVAVTGIMTFAQYGGMAVNPAGNFEMPLWKLGTDKDLEVDITTGDVDGWISYAIVSV